MFDPDLHARLLSAVSEPNVAFILLMIGLYGLIIEFGHPGALAPGIIGAISLILAIVGLSALPVNFGGLALLLAGIALMLGEAFTPGFGALGLGGLACFAIGSYFLLGQANGVDYGVSLPLIAGATLTTAALIFGVIAAVMKARRRRAMTGAEQAIGALAQVIDWTGDSGHVRFNGEVWSARSKRPLQPGAAVRIVKRDGLILFVDS
jgi:membrane-bound serine protease (ClpP class)